MRYIQDRHRSLLILAGVSFAIGVLSQGSFFDFQAAFKVGDVSPQDIKAPVDLRVLDEAATQKRREAIAASVREVYDFDSELNESLLRRLEEVTALFADRSVNRRVNLELRMKVEQRLKAKLSDEEWAFITRPNVALVLLRSVATRLLDSRRIWIVRDMPSDAIVIREVTTGQEASVSRGQLEAQAQTVLAARNEITSLFANDRLVRRISPAQGKILQGLLTKILIENLSFNSVETAARRDEAQLKVEPSFIEAKKGEMLLREGQRAEPRHLLMLQQVRDSRSGKFNFSEAVLFALLFGFVAIVLFYVGKRNFKKFKLTFRDQWVMGSFLVGSTALITGLFYLFRRAGEESLVGSLLIYLLPIGFSGMTLRLFTSMEITTFFAILQALGFSWIMRDPYFGIMTLCASLAGAARMRRISQRMDVFKAGLTSGIVILIMALLGWALELRVSPPFENVWIETGFIFLFSLASGLISAGFVLAIQPLLENLGYTTDLRLMELSRTDHPLLKDLILKAPGTYFHSFTVSQLAEKAADAIRANSLFARVASLYHDIGKIQKPQYFIENIKGENKHDKLAPTMSALIISNHVKDGIELGLQYKLPINIIEVIPQHHGTSLISYFHDKAKKQATEQTQVNEKDFRYSGPKPQTKEAAIILMADAVEATAKSMGQASEDQIRQMVHKTIQRFFLDGQLDECDLSLKDLAAIGNAFFQVLQGVYHQRIDYPHLKSDQISIPQLKTTP